MVAGKYAISYILVYLLDSDFPSDQVIRFRVVATTWSFFFAEVCHFPSNMIYGYVAERSL